MARHTRHRWLLAIGWLAASGPVAPAIAQLAPRPPLAPMPTATPTTPAASPADVMRAALASNPITAPYPIQTFERNGRVVLRGVVGTKVIYDAAVRTAIASGIPFADELVIDTLAAHDVAARGAAAALAAAPPIAPPIAPTYGAFGGYPPPTYMPFGPAAGGAPGLIYPPPLFGVLDEPFFGFEPPVISYPPYWGALSARRLAEARAFGPGVGAIPVPDGPEPPPGTVDVEIDPLGVAKLRGVVPSLADRVAIGQKLAQTPGVSQVINLLRVDPALASSAVARPTPPDPEPRPIDPKPEAPARPAPQPPAPALDLAPPVDLPPADPPADDAPLTSLPILDDLAIRATLADGTATIEGRVPTALDAMDAYLAVKRHPGVAEVVDRLQFPVPIDPADNPLRSADDPRDVEEYLGDQARRHLDGIALVDRVRLLGRRLEVQGRPIDPGDGPRAEATLRSTPVLRGFDLDMRFDPPTP